MSDPFLNHKEPEEIFLPLGEEQYAEFYALEMADFTEDIVFYQDHCSKGSRILELGCGSGRISQALSNSGCRVTGLDTSHYMLQQALLQKNTHPNYVCMDMCRMAFTVKFDHILIPYNTLNLLGDEIAICSCLQQVRQLLLPGGSLLLQIYLPDTKLLEKIGEKLFQFQMFPLANNKGKLIKETLRSYLQESQEICLEERYRFRSTEKDRKRMDLSHTLSLAAYPLKQWLLLIQKIGFHDISLYGDFDSRPFEPGKDSLLLIKARIS